MLLLPPLRLPDDTLPPLRLPDDMLLDERVPDERVPDDDELLLRPDDTLLERVLVFVPRDTDCVWREVDCV